MPDKKEIIFNHLAESEQAYLSQWYLDSPVVITSQKYQELNHIRRLLHKAICFFVRHYDDYGHIFPMTDRIRRIVDICRPFPFRTGTYRPDFLIGTDKQLRICEIGARFPLNGYFLSGISEYIGNRRFAYQSYLDKPEYSRFLQYLSEYWNHTDTLYVLKGMDKPCDIKYYTPYFEGLGMKVEIIHPGEIRQHRFNETSCVINEFNQMEIDLLDDDTLRMIASSNALNDMRTIFLIHDKRFLAVLSDAAFLSEVFDETEISVLRPYLIPTYTPTRHPEIWEKARINKDEWVIKNALLGKSEQVYSGRTCTREEWEPLFSPQVKNTMVLQPFIHQLRISSTLKGESYCDYAVGTLLCFDHQFFGPGIFRTSSFEITNRTDDRKMAPCFTDFDLGSKNCFIL